MGLRPGSWTVLSTGRAARSSAPRWKPSGRRSGLVRSTTRRSVLGWRRTKRGVAHRAGRGLCCGMGRRCRALLASPARGKQMTGQSAPHRAGQAPSLEMFRVLLTLPSLSRVVRCSRRSARTYAGPTTSPSASARLACGLPRTGASATASAAAPPRPAQLPAPGPAPTRHPTSPSPARHWSAGHYQRGPPAPQPAAPVSKPVRPPASPRTAPGSRLRWSSPARAAAGWPGTGVFAPGPAPAGSRRGT
mmetsp:Transcript_88685/g.202851  ORF Transcript_88685/g.202851 Transcript_88685/m.202851 type:complete len:247 (+) Transcript_88685:289-1029(+)